MTEYLLTGFVYKRLKSLGFIFSCYRCGEPITLGDRVVSKSGAGVRVKKLCYKHCQENQSAKDVEQPTYTKNRQVLLIPGHHFKQPASRIRLVKGEYSSNPGEVLCPNLIKSGKCNKHRIDKDFNWTYKRPKLLLKHHSNSNLELWECEGCKDFLMKVRVQA